VENKLYPTQPNNDGFFYENEGDEAMGILTKEYENGHKVKQLQLSTGKTAIVRELMGKEVLKYQRLAEGDREKVLPAMMAIAIKIDGAELLMEDYLEDIKAKDYHKLMLACQDLNF